VESDADDPLPDAPQAVRVSTMPSASIVDNVFFILSFLLKTNTVFVLNTFSLSYAGK
jgi:hypothetical protein